ncbi:MAG: glutamate 5-kinase [Planctomycetota bacterium]|nr:MAG: glutamate 5-kinase [Planctomycetota bacterium]
MRAMPDLVRRELVETCRTLVVKVGSNVLTGDDGRIEQSRIEALAAQVARIQATGRHVIIVSSGAVAAGMEVMGLDERPADLPHLQATAAIGQARLIARYERALQTHGVHAAQLLLTAGDLESRPRYLNVRNTVNTLFEYHVIPVVNENDTVSTEEIQFGDNDQLAALMANLVPSPLLVILTSVDGLYDGDPHAPGSRRIDVVDRWSDELLRLVHDTKTRHGTGGMASKLRAIRAATAVGESVILCSGLEPNVLDRVMAGDAVGTLFLAQGAAVPAWKRWIGYSARCRGRIVVDAGACRALCRDGRSLLPIGITRVEGRFERGDVIAVCGPDGGEFARGLTNYGSEDLKRLAGKRTSAIAEELGNMPYVEAIHRDNLVITRMPPETLWQQAAG